MAGGRPSKYDPSYPDQAYKLALLGLTDAEVAQFFGVDPDTIYEWDKAHPEFSETRARGKIPADADVAVSLRQRALGYSHPDVHVSAQGGAVTLTPIVKYYPPDTQAASLWLRNRQPDKWKERTEQAITGELNVRRVISEAPMTEEAWVAANVTSDAT